MDAFARELEVARRLTLEAGALVARYRGTDLAVDRKARGEPVTRADRESSALILAGLGAVFPDDLVISEEEPPDLERLVTARRVWFVDPLDGTRDFIGGQPGFAPMIGLAVDGEPRIAAVYQPVGDILYLAAPGLALLVAAGRETPLRCAADVDPAHIRLVASKSHRTDRIDQVRAVLGIDDELNLGSVGLKVGLIARGERDLYVNPGSSSKAWDTCAPQALLHEAGGRLTDLDGEPLSYRGPDLVNRRGLLAAPAALHAQVLPRLRPLFAKPRG